MRRCLGILGTLCFVAFATGLPAVLHLLHEEHGGDTRHDANQCVVCQAISATSKAVTSVTSLQAVTLDPAYRDHRVAPHAPRLAELRLPIASRAPPIFT